MGYGVCFVHDEAAPAAQRGPRWHVGLSFLLTNLSDHVRHIIFVQGLPVRNITDASALEMLNLIIVKAQDILE